LLELLLHLAVQHILLIVLAAESLPVELEHLAVWHEELQIMLDILKLDKRLRDVLELLEQ
jgi:hypothetical protein